MKKQKRVICGKEDDSITTSPLHTVLIMLTTMLKFTGIIVHWNTNRKAHVGCFLIASCLANCFHEC